MRISLLVMGLLVACGVCVWSAAGPDAARAARESSKPVGAGQRGAPGVVADGDCEGWGSIGGRLPPCAR